MKNLKIPKQFPERGFGFEFIPPKFEGRPFEIHVFLGGRIEPFLFSTEEAWEMSRWLLSVLIERNNLPETEPCPPI